MPYRQPLLMLLVLTLSSAARAQEDQSPEALMDRALALRAEDREEEAHPLLVRAFEASGTPRARAQLALSHQALGHWREAYEGLTLALATEDPWIASRREPLEGALATVRAHVALLTVVGEPAGAEVLLDAEPRGSLPLPGPLAVDPGTVSLELRMQGRAPEVRVLALAAGESHTERVSLAAGGASASSGGGSSATPWIVGSLSAGVVIAGALMLGFGRADAAAVEGAPVGTEWASVSDAAERAPILSGVGITALAAGAIGVAAAILIAIMEGGGESSTAALELATGTLRF
jgi:hypothetical protein